MSGQSDYKVTVRPVVEVFREPKKLCLAILDENQTCSLVIWQGRAEGGAHRGANPSLLSPRL